MKHLFQTIALPLMLAGFIISSCKKDNACEGCQTNSPVNKPNMPPVAFAGLDQTVELPKDSVFLYGNGSYDPDGKITKWKWSKISGPSSFNIENVESAMTKATNLVEGVYHFELTVTDSLGLIDKDTVNVTVKTINLTEIIFSNQTWECWWGCWIEIPNIYSYVPAGSVFSVYIKRDNSNTWEQAQEGAQTGYGFIIDYGSLFVFGEEGLILDTPDIKIVY